MRALSLKPSDYAWIALVAGIAVYEWLFRDELMSTAADRYRAAHPWPTYGIVIATALHLTRAYPKRWDWLDPFHTELYVRTGSGLRRAVMVRRNAGPPELIVERDHQ